MGKDPNDSDIQIVQDPVTGKQEFVAIVRMTTFSVKPLDILDIAGILQDNLKASTTPGKVQQEFAVRSKVKEVWQIKT